MNLLMKGRASHYSGKRVWGLFLRHRNN